MGPPPPIQAPSRPEAGSDAATARRVLRKIDRVVVPLLFVTYIFNYVDKVILASAAVFGLRTDTHLVGQQYSWVSSIFYFGYLVWEYPTTLLVARLPAAKFLSLNVFIWGVVVALTATCTNFAGLMAVRFFLGMAEATVSSALMYITATWYTRDEMPTRVGIMFAGNSIGGIVSNLLAFGIGHIHDHGHGHPWRWMYAVLGAVTVLWSVVVFFLLPDGISTAKFLTPEERRVAADRTAIAGTGTTAGARWNWDQLAECLADPKTWLISAMVLVDQMPSSGLQSFSNIIVSSLDFTPLQSTLINLPVSVIAAAVMAGTGWLAGRYRTVNCLLIIATLVPCVVGAGIIYRRDRTSHGAQLFAYFLFAFGPATMTLLLALVQSNYRGVTKKMTMTALVFLAYCAGNVAGPQFFRASEAPEYRTAFQAIMICYALVVALAVVLRVYLQRLNARRVKVEGFEGSAGAAGAVGAAAAAAANGKDVRKDIAEAVTVVQLQPEDYEDVTDWKTVGFRYRL